MADGFSLRAAGMLVAAVALAIGLGGCGTPAPKPSYSPVSFGHLPPIRLDVARIEIVTEYRMPGKRPNVDHLFPVKPLAMAELWGRDRLRAVGASGVARVTIKDARVIEVPLQRTTGIRGVLTTDQSERYDAAIEIELRILGAGGRQRGVISSRTERSRSVAEGISPLERDKIWYEITEAMMNDLNASLEGQIRRNLKSFVR